MTILLSKQAILTLTEGSLKEFVSLQVPEGARIDYKENITLDNKHEVYREFLKDVTSFANAIGGIILLGVREPSDDVSVDDQVSGLLNGDKIAKDLERVAASSIDPRIPGLLISPVSLSNGNYVIVVYVPPSMIRPHMVRHRKHRSFYVRHSESSVPMTTHEIRETVLSSATSEGIARNYAQREEIEVLEYIIEDKPSFLLQAIPLLSIEQSWDVLDKSIIEIVRGDKRRNKYGFGRFDLCSDILPTPTISGVKGRESRETSPWRTDVHRNGYIQAVYHADAERLNDELIYPLHAGYLDLFRAFSDFCIELWKFTQTDIPYLIRCKLFNARGVRFLKDYPRNKLSEPYDRSELIWQDKVRQVGESLEAIYNTWAQGLFNAFGIVWNPQR